MDIKTIDTNAFAETLFIIRCLSYNDQNKIPRNFIEFLNKNKNDNYVVKINPNISLENQKLLKETKELLKEIYISFFISNEERKKILQQDKYIKIIEENLKNQKYNTNDIFPKVDTKKNTNTESSEEHSNTVLIEYKESFFTRFKNFIYKTFHH